MSQAPARWFVVNEALLVAALQQVATGEAHPAVARLELELGAADPANPLVRLIELDAPLPVPVPELLEPAELERRRAERTAAELGAPNAGELARLCRETCAAVTAALEAELPAWAGATLANVRARAASILDAMGDTQPA